MIHDVLLSCLDLQSQHLPIELLVVSDAVSKFFHPSEKKILEDIIHIINLLRDVSRFAKIYGSNYNSVLNSPFIDTDDPLPNGLYLRAFANGIEAVLADYFVEITELERRYLQNPTFSLMFIYQKLHEYEYLAIDIRKLIRGIRIHKLHGCSIMQYLYQNLQHGDQRISKAMKKIFNTVNVVFLKQLTNWLLYAKVVDSYDEFFIQSESRNDSTIDSEKCASTGSGKQTVTTMSEVASSYTDIWRYEVCYDLLPYYFPTSWAEKILFIGQTVLIFKVDSNNTTHKSFTANDIEKNILKCEASLWNEKEHVYFKKIQELQNDEELNVSHYERVVDEIKSYVTSRLSEIAVNQADLVKQLKLIKDYYLLGRGELFLEYIRQTYIISKNEENENKLSDYVKAFETAAHAVGVSDDLEQFSLYIPKSTLDAEETQEFGYMQCVQLQYKINWPLHLLFSPKVLERYNVLFRFLLLIKKLQFDLHMIWNIQTSEAKHKQTRDVNVLYLRNQLMFFIDNLQYYIQVDVLESQFSILLNTILNKADFEQIQRAHSVFQANVLSLCFLLSDDDAIKGDQGFSSTFLQSNNPVFIVLNDICHLCEDFCNILELQSNEDDDFNNTINKLEERFGNLIEQLINLLIGLKTAPSTTPLSQLLLRLDFNNWFSLKKKRENELI